MNDSPTGSDQQSDSTITITIDEVRSINKKLIERKYLLEIVAEQDSVIKHQDNYIQEEKRIARELQDKLSSNSFLHKQMVNSLNRQKVLSACLGASLAISIILLLVK